MTLHYFVLHIVWATFHHPFCQRCPFAYLHNFYCCEYRQL